MKSLRIYPEKCVGCKLCELACSFRHFKEFNPSKSFVFNASFCDEPFFFTSIVCFQCKEPYCMEICPAKAINWNDETGAVVVDKQRCVGCKMCSLACPFGNIVFIEDEGVSMKCDLCDGDPECVKICPEEAILYVEDCEGNFEKRKSYLEIIKDCYMGTREADNSVI